ncbi:hypothetical protein AB4Z48_23830 [Cupriavidus sp. 2TAF22]|uniref:hypothetical protein n=1 Tax=unclassified Cupriavidus TaxID=2640874 RepID=UPI003F930B36
MKASYRVNASRHACADRPQGACALAGGRLIDVHRHGVGARLHDAGNRKLEAGSLYPLKLRFYWTRGRKSPS